jgi:phage regulator Rha-like protein
MKHDEIIVQEDIEQKIYLARGVKVMFDIDLAKLYGVETKTLNRAVKRNIDKFPRDFMIQLTKEEFDNLRCQIGTSKWGGRRYLPYAFTEHGILMLANVLNSKRAIRVSIAIVRAFVSLRRLIDTNKDVAQKISQLERKYEHHDFQIQKLFDKVKDIPKLQERFPKVKGFISE